MKLVAAGHNPMDLKRGIDRGVEVITQALEKLSQPVKDRADIQHVGTVSANDDETVGQMLADAMDKVGKEGDRASTREGPEETSRTSTKPP